jgi:hypothetical protein
MHVWNNFLKLLFLCEWSPWGWPAEAETCSKDIAKWLIIVCCWLCNSFHYILHTPCYSQFTGLFIEVVFGFACVCVQFRYLQSLSEAFKDVCMCVCWHQRNKKEFYFLEGRVRVSSAYTKKTRSAVGNVVTGGRLQHVSCAYHSNRDTLCETVGFRRGGTELFRLLGYYSAWGGSKPTFGDYPSVPSSRVKITVEDATDR